MTYKEAINRILTSVGEIPIDSNPSEHIKNPTVSIILRSLDDISKQLQNRGYWFNTRYVTITPNFKQQMIVPEGTVNWESDTVTSYLQGDKLVKAVDGSTLWEATDKEKGKVIVLIPFELLPHSFAELVVLKANMQSYLNTFGVDEHYQVLANQVYQAEDDLTADVVRFAKYNTRNKRAYRNIDRARFK